MDSLSLSSKSLLLFLLLFMSASQAAAAEEATTRLPPAAALAEAAELRQSRLVSVGYRRKLGSFQICALCTCCGGPRGLCLPSPCCYAINCNIPNRPFGFCSFTPKTCNCLGCHL